VVSHNTRQQKGQNELENKRVLSLNHIYIRLSDLSNPHSCTAAAASFLLSQSLHI